MALLSYAQFTEYIHKMQCVQKCSVLHKLQLIYSL